MPCALLKLLVASPAHRTAGPQCTSCFPFPFLTDCGNGQRETPPLPPSYPNLRLELLDQRPIIQCDQSEVETVFGVIKEVLGFRRFHLRGLRGAQGEWTLVCTAWNLKRLYALAGA